MNRPEACLWWGLQAPNCRRQLWWGLGGHFPGCGDLLSKTKGLHVPSPRPALGHMSVMSLLP